MEWSKSRSRGVVKRLRYCFWSRDIVVWKIYSFFRIFVSYLKDFELGGRN